MTLRSRMMLPSAVLLGACVSATSVGQLDTDDSQHSSTYGGGGGGLDTGGPSPSTTAPSPTTGADPTGPAGTNASDDTSGLDTDGMDSSGFIILETGGWCDAELPPGTLAHCSYCDVWSQDCPEGEKCMPEADDGGPDFNAARCSPIAADPQQAGEACHVEDHSTSGLDDCDFGLICFHVDPDTLEGVCVSMCTGSRGAPICPEGSQCDISAEGMLTLCLDTCDPLDDTCAMGTCISHGEGFACQQLPADTPVGEPCELVGQCVSGSTCLDAAATGPCADGTSCCTSFCDLTAVDPDAQCLAGQTCVSWYDGEPAPADLAHVGVCLLPPP